jgi:hypothetical protein
MELQGTIHYKRSDPRKGRFYEEQHVDLVAVCSKASGLVEGFESFTPGDCTWDDISFLSANHV